MDKAQVRRKNALNSNALGNGSTTQITYNITPGSGLPISYSGPTATSPAIQLNVTGDTNNRWVLNVSGTQTFSDGTGTAANTVILAYKGSGSELQVQDSTGAVLGTINAGKFISLAQTATNTRVFEVALSTDSFRRLFATAGGKLGVGTGTSSSVQVLGINSTSGYMTLANTESAETGGDFRSDNLTGNVQVSTPLIVTSAGDLTITPAGSNVKLSGKNLNNFATATATTSLVTPLLTSASGDLNISSAGTNVNLSGKTLKNVPVIDASVAGSLQISGGFVNMLLNDIRAANSITANSLTSPLINTTSGNLVLNPTGSAVDFSGKQIINAILPSSGLTFPISYTSPNGTNKFLFVNQTGDSYERWAVDASGMQTFGPGSASIANDVWFYRTNVGELLISGQPPSNGVKNGALAVNTIRGVDGLSFNVAGDILLNPSGVVNVNGKTLQNGVLTYANNTVVSTFISSRIVGDTYDRVQIDNQGFIYFGGGTATPDISFSRQDANTLRVNGGLGFSRGNLRFDTAYSNNITSNTFNYVNVCASGSTNGTGTNNTSISTTGADFSLGTNRSTAISSGSISFGAGNSCASVGSAATSFGSGSNNVSIANTACTMGSTQYSTIMSSTNGTITATSGCNMILGSGNGNTSITGTAGGTLLWGSYISTNNANVFGVSDSSSTAVSVGTSKTFYGRMSGGYYLATNAAASTGMQLSGGSSSWGAISDARLKRIHDEVRVLDKVEKLRVVRYNYKSDEEHEEPRLGMIAQDVNTLYADLGVRRNYSLNHPESKEGDPIQTVSGDEIAYLSLAAIKELKVEVESLRSENANLRHASDQLHNEIDRLTVAHSSLESKYDALADETRKLRDGLAKVMNVLRSAKPTDKK